MRAIRGSSGRDCVLIIYFNFVAVGLRLGFLKVIIPLPPPPPQASYWEKIYSNINILSNLLKFLIKRNGIIL